MGDFVGLLGGLDAMEDEQRGVVEDEVGSAADAPVEAALGAPQALLECSG